MGKITSLGMLCRLFAVKLQNEDILDLLLNKVNVRECDGGMCYRLAAFSHFNHMQSSVE